MIPLQISLQEDSKTSRFVFFRFFSEFIWNFKFYSQNNKEVPEDTIHLSHGLRRQPPGFLFLSTRGPWPWSEEGRGFDRPNPATVITSGEGGGAWEVHQALAHL